MKRLILAACLGSLASLVTLGQSAKSPAFEVASIRPHEGPLRRMMGLDVSGPRIMMEGYSVFLLVMEAYNVRPDQISVAAVHPQEEDIRSTMYNIMALSPGEGAPSRPQIRQMLQTLLADRFKLAVHHEMKEMPVYALALSKSGPKLKRSDVDTPCSVHVGFASDGRNSEAKFLGCAIGSLVDVLVNIGGLGRPIVEKTGLTDKYDFTLVVASAYKSQKDPDPGDISPLIAVRALGLTLEAQKAPVEIIAIDRVEKPSEN